MAGPSPGAAIATALDAAAVTGGATFAAVPDAGLAAAEALAVPVCFCCSLLLSVGTMLREAGD